MNKTIENQCERVAEAIEKTAAELGSDLPREEALHSHFMKSECKGIGSGASVGGVEAHSHFMKSECGNISNCKHISRKGQLRNGGMRNGED